MKKLFTILMAGIIVMSAASCNGAPAATTTQSETTTAVSETAPETTEATEDTEGTAPDEGMPDESTPEEGGENTEQTDAMKLTAAILNSGIELPAMTDVFEEEIISDVMGYDMSIAADYSVVTNIISAQLLEFVVIKPADGKEQEVMDMLNARMETLKTSVAWYPEQIENAEATIVGSYKGYCYLLCDKLSADEEAALKSAIDAM